MEAFEDILARAVMRKGGEAVVEEQVTMAERFLRDLSKVPEDRFLAEMTRAIFKAGFVWKVIDAKWQGFEDAFHNFDIGACLFLDPDELDALGRDERIIRNMQKIVTVPQNAKMIADVAGEHGTFGAFLQTWPEDDYVGLLDYLHKHGSRLGGQTSQFFLRFVGKDGFVLSRDGVRAMIEAGALEKPPTGKAGMKKVQAAYNTWREETGYSTIRISRILSMSTGD